MDKIKTWRELAQRNPEARICRELDLAADTVESLERELSASQRDAQAALDRAQKAERERDEAKYKPIMDLGPGCDNNHNRYWTTHYGRCMACRVEALEAKLATQSQEMVRLKAVEHAAWHVCESSEERVVTREIVVDRHDFYALAELLSEDCPSVEETNK